MKEAITLLEGAKALLSSPDAWTKESFARDKYDEHTDIESPAACKFCSIGAIYRLVGTTQEDINALSHATRSLTAVIKKKFGDKFGDLAYFNDRPATTHQDVLNLFSEAIEHLKQQ